MNPRLDFPNAAPAAFRAMLTLQQQAEQASEAPQRLHLLPAWRESPGYDARERAALAWAEALTLVHRSHAPDTDYEAVRAQFNEAETVELTLAIAAINAWNRLCIAFRSQPALA